MKTYQGHRSWNAWNVSLWINNDESLYFTAVDYCKRAKSLDRAVNMFYQDVQGSKTPDGAIFNRLSIKSAIGDIWNEFNSK